MSRRPVILTTSFHRPYSVYTHKGVDVNETRHAWGTVGEVCELIAGHLGATTLQIPTNMADEDVADMVRMADGIVLPGGTSMVHPERFGLAPIHDRQIFDPERDRLELAIMHAARKFRTPVLGICRGTQLINVFYGGTLTLSPDCSNEIDHMCSETTIGRSEEEKHTHGLVVEPGSRLGEWLGRAALGDLRVNSIHHQAVKSLGSGLVVEARAPDGVIEAIRLGQPDHFVYGAQWHPEYNIENRASRVILDVFRDEVLKYRKGKPLQRLLSAWR